MLFEFYPSPLPCTFCSVNNVIILAGLIDQTVDYDVPGLNKSSDENGFVCDCLPACSSLSYNAEFSQTHFNWKEVLIAFRESLDQLPGYVNTYTYTKKIKSKLFIRTVR